MVQAGCVFVLAAFALPRSIRKSRLMEVKGFVISMARSGQRMENVRQIISKCPAECNRFDAIDGSRLSDLEIDSVYKKNFYQPRYPFTMNRGEIGCFLSHRSIWQKIAESDAPGGLVMEDDIELLDGFSAVLDFAVEATPPCGYIQFQTRDLGRNHKTIAKHENLQMVRPQVVPLRATAQWITRQAAAKLLGVTQVFDRPIDTFIQMRWLHGVDVLVLTPPCVREVSGSLGGSVINARKQRKPMWPQLARDWRRFVYRKQVGIRSRYAA